MADDYRGWGQLDRHARALWRDGHTEPDTPGAAEVGGSEAVRRDARHVGDRRRHQAHRLIGHVAQTRPVTVVDAWGGDGYVAREICTAWPTATCTVLAIPPVTRTARAACAGHPRIAVVACDLQTGDPGEALGRAQVDVVVLSHVLEKLRRQRRRELSAQVARVLAPGGCLLSSEFVRPRNDRDSLDVALRTVARAAANAGGGTLSEFEQDMLVRGSGLAAVASWWVARSTRAVLGVKPATGVEPALRIVDA